MASKKEKTLNEPVEVAEEQPNEAVAEEDDKLDIDDIKDPEDKPDEPEEKEEADLDIEEVVEEKEEPVVAEESNPEKPKKEKKSFFGRKKNKPAKAEKSKKEPDKVPDPSNEPLFVPKKKSAFSKILTVIFTIIVTAAVVLGGVYAYLTYFRPQPTKTETQENTNAEEEVKTPTVSDKFVWVDSTAGLNLRQEPSTVAEILAIIPNGTKLKVLDENAGWYQVEYDSKEGWVSKDFVVAKNPLTYENTTYGFTIEFPTSYAGYKIFTKETNWGSFTTKTLYFTLPTTDKNWVEQGVTKGYASMFAVTPFTKAQWAQLDPNDITKMDKLAESSTYVITGGPAQATPTDLATKYKDAATVLKALELIK